MSEPSRINCFRCRHCSMVAPDNLVVIKCARRDAGDQVVDVVLNHCPHAEWSRNANDLALAYMRHHYPKSDLDWLAWVLTRKRENLKELARRRGIRRQVPTDYSAMARRSIALRTKFQAYTPAQRDYMASVAFGPDWPAQGRDASGQQRRKREIIMDKLARLGPRRPWCSVKAFAHRNLSASAQRRR